MATQRRLLDSITENDPWIVITAEADSRTYAQRGGHTRKKRAPGEHEQSSTAGLRPDEKHSLLHRSLSHTAVMDKAELQEMVMSGDCLPQLSRLQSLELDELERRVAESNIQFFRKKKNRKPPISNVFPSEVASTLERGMSTKSESEQNALEDDSLHSPNQERLQEKDECEETETRRQHGGRRSERSSSGNMKTPVLDLPLDGDQGPGTKKKKKKKKKKTERDVLSPRRHQKGDKKVVSSPALGSSLSIAIVVSPPASPRARKPPLRASSSARKIAAEDGSMPKQEREREQEQIRVDLQRRKKSLNTSKQQRRSRSFSDLSHLFLEQGLEEEKTAPKEKEEEKEKKREKMTKRKQDKADKEDGCGDGTQENMEKVRDESAQGAGETPLPVEKAVAPCPSVIINSDPSQKPDGPITHRDRRLGRVAKRMLTRSTSEQQLKRLASRLPSLLQVGKGGKSIIVDPKMGPDDQASEDQVAEIGPDDQGERDDMVVVQVKAGRVFGVSLPEVLDLQHFLCKAGSEPSSPERSSSSKSQLNSSCPVLFTVSRDDARLPMVLIALVNGILQFGGAQATGLFRVPGKKATMDAIRERFNSGVYHFEEGTSPHDLASLLKEWLRTVSPSLIPAELYAKCVEVSGRPSECVDVIEVDVPELSRLVIKYVLKFLQERILSPEVQRATRMDIRSIATTFAPCLLDNPAIPPEEQLKNIQAQIKFVVNLLMLLNVNVSKMSSTSVPVRKPKNATTETAPMEGSEEKPPTTKAKKRALTASHEKGGLGLVKRWHERAKAIGGSPTRGD